jgi:hypothetical protein
VRSIQPHYNRFRVRITGDRMFAEGQKRRESS